MANPLAVFYQANKNLLKEGESLPKSLLPLDAVEMTKDVEGDDVPYEYLSQARPVSRQSSAVAPVTKKLVPEPARNKRRPAREEEEDDEEDEDSRPGRKKLQPEPKRRKEKPAVDQEAPAPFRKRRATQGISMQLRRAKLVYNATTNPAKYTAKLHDLIRQTWAGEGYQTPLTKQNIAMAVKYSANDDDDPFAYFVVSTDGVAMVKINPRLLPLVKTMEDD